MHYKTCRCDLLIKRENERKKPSEAFYRVSDSDEVKFLKGSDNDSYLFQVFINI